MAGTTVADDGSVMAAFTAAVEQFGLAPGTPGYDAGAGVSCTHTMGQSKIEVFRHILGDEEAAPAGQPAPSRSTTRRRCGPARSRRCRAPSETIAALRAAGIKVCLATGFAPATRDALLDALGWRPLIDLALSPADAGRGRPWPDLPLTALLRLGGGSGQRARRGRGHAQRRGVRACAPGPGWWPAC